MFFFLILGLYPTCYLYYGFCAKETDSDIVADGFTASVPMTISRKDIV